MVDAFAQVLSYQVRWDIEGKTFYDTSDGCVCLFQSLVMTNIGDDGVIFLYLGDGSLSYQCFLEQGDSISCEG